MRLDEKKCLPFYFYTMGNMWSNFRLLVLEKKSVRCNGKMLMLEFFNIR